MAVALDTADLNREGDRESKMGRLKSRQREMEKERETAGHIV